MPFTVKLMRSPLAVEFEVGSIEEGLGILQDSKDKFRELLEFSSELGGNADDGVTTTLTPSSEQGEAAPAGGNKRGRKPKAAAEATAPAPIPVPGAAPPATPAPAAPIDTTPGANGIPAFLDRTKDAAAAAPPPPPLMPAAPPVAPPAATPQFILGNKIADNLQKRLDGSLDKGEALHAWLMPTIAGLILPTATIDEAIAVLRFTADDKVAHLAAPLGIS